MKNDVSTIALKSPEPIADCGPGRDFLRENGVTNPSTIAAYHVSSVPVDMEIGGRRVGHNGVIIPTFDPHAPKKLVGYVRCWNPSYRHQFVTPPAGLILPSDIAAHQRVILTDIPMLCLRLAQAGVRGATCAEEPAKVLPQYRGWLASKSLVVVAARKEWVESLRKIVADIGLKSEAVQVHADLPRTSSEALDLLGLSKDVLNPPIQVPITPLLLRDFMQFAQARIQEGVGLDALRQMGADDPDFVHAYSLGFLPSRFRAALDSSTRAAVSHHRIENSIVVPAYDDFGNVVDLLAVHCIEKSGGKTHVNVGDHPAGMIAQKIAKAYEDIVVVDTFGLAATLFKSGRKNVILFRGVEDLKQNVERLWKSGVRSADVMFRRNPDDAVAALEASGIVAEDCGVPRSHDDLEKAALKLESKPAKRLLLANEESKPGEPSLPPIEAISVTSAAQEEESAPAASKLELVKHDHRFQQATFKIGEATYVSEIPFDSSAKLAVEIRQGDKFHRDRFDLNSEAQRKRFSTSGALRTGVSFELIAEHLLHLLDAVRALQQDIANPAKQKSPLIVMTDVEKDAAKAYLKRPDLLDALVHDMERLGWTGEEKLKRHLLLLAVSRLQEKPISAVLRAPPSSGKSFAIETLSQTLPPEEVVHVSSLSGSALQYNADLRHKLLVIDEADALTPEVIVALRVLQSRGALSHSSTARDAVSGQTVAHFSEAHGPVAVLTSTTSELDGEFLSRCYDLAVDTSLAQTERILAAQRRAVGNAKLFGDAVKKGIVNLHRNIHRLLRSGLNRVSVPFFERIEFPGASVRHRREQEKFLGLLQASALLHQHQRARQWIDGVEYVVAVERDFEIAVALVTESAALSPETLAQSARVLLAEIRAANLTTFTMEHLRKLRPEWDRQRFRTGLGELLELGYIVSPTGGRGRLREYKAAAGTFASFGQAGRIRLLSEAEMVELVRVGFSKETNFTPKTATG